MVKVESHKYSNGQDFFMVYCSKCHAYLNSGHHYNPHELHFAQTLAFQHVDHKH